MSSDLIAITGANGFVGGRVMGFLREQGLEAVGVVRAGRELAGRDWVRREVPAWSSQHLGVALRGVSTLVHAASVVHKPGAPADEHVAFNVEGTRTLLDAAKTAGVRRIVFLSTIKVYGEEPTGTIDESTAVDRGSPYAATKLQAEEILLDSAAQGGPSTVVLRLCPVYGAGDKGNVRRVATAIARRRFAVPGDGSTRKSVVHVSTVAKAVHRAITDGASGVFVLSDRHAPSMRELADTVASALGRAAPPSIPIPVAIAASAVLETFARVRGREPTASPELIRKSLRSTVCSPQRFEHQFALECHLDLAVGVAEEVEWLRRERLV